MSVETFVHLYSCDDNQIINQCGGLKLPVTRRLATEYFTLA